MGKMLKIKQIYINAGNSRITAGYFRGKRFIYLGRWKSCTAELKKIELNKFGCEKIIMASVVPEISKLLKKKFPGKVIEAKNKDVPVLNLYKNKELAGVDRLLACFGALRKYKKNCVVVDLGTATTLNLITKRGEFKGGLIAPGAGFFSNYLFEKTARLPRIALYGVKRALGKSTEECIRAGIYFGNIEMIGGLIRRIKKEAGESVLTVATGGWGTVFAGAIKEIDKYDPELIFYGMKELLGHEKNL